MTLEKNMDIDTSSVKQVDIESLKQRIHGSEFVLKQMLENYQSFVKEGKREEERLDFTHPSNLDIELSYEKELFDQFKMVYVQQDAKSKLLRKCLDVSFVNSTTQEVDELETGFKKIKDLISAIKENSKETADTLVHDLHELVSSWEDLNNMIASLDLMHKNLEDTIDEETNLTAESTVDMAKEIQENEAHLLNIASETESLKAIMDELKQKQSLLQVTDESLEHELAKELRPAIKETLEYSNELDKLVEKADPKIETLANWYQNNLASLCALLSIKTIHIEKGNRLIIEYYIGKEEEFITLCIIIHNNEISIELAHENKGCPLTDIVSYANANYYYKLDDMLTYAINSCGSRLKNYYLRCKEISSLLTTTPDILYDQDNSEIGWTRRLADGTEYTIVISIGLEYPMSGNIGILDVSLISDGVEEKRGEEFIAYCQGKVKELGIKTVTRLIEQEQQLLM